MKFRLAIIVLFFAVVVSIGGSVFVCKGYDGITKPPGPKDPPSSAITQDYG